MRGYKAFNKGWNCRGFQYEIGKTYELKEDETLEICRCGFHFCRNPNFDAKNIQINNWC